MEVRRLDDILRILLCARLTSTCGLCSCWVATAVSVRHMSWNRDRVRHFGSCEERRVACRLCEQTYRGRSPMSLTVSRKKIREFQMSEILPGIQKGICRWLTAGLAQGQYSRSRRRLLNRTARRSLSTYSCLSPFLQIKGKPDSGTHTYCCVGRGRICCERLLLGAALQCSGRSWA